MYYGTRTLTQRRCPPGPEQALEADELFHCWAACYCVQARAVDRAYARLVLLALQVCTNHLRAQCTQSQM